MIMDNGESPVGDVEDPPLTMARRREELSREAREDPELAEQLKNRIPDVYYSFDWTPDP